ncbi:hypothetical protein ACU8KO_002654 [Vibrio alginolyticus]
MKFHYLPKVNTEQNALELRSAPEILTFNNSEKCWYGKDGTRYETHGAGNPIPMSNDEDKYECLGGYFIVEVTDPKSVKGQFKLHAENEIVSCGSGLYPGATCDDEKEGKKLEEAGLQKPDMGFDFLPHCICYGFNDGAAIDGAIELSPYVEGKDDYDPDTEEPYAWRII